MKFTWFNLMPWPYLPDNFRENHRSVWVDLPNKLYDPKKGYRISSPSEQDSQTTLKNEERREGRNLLRALTIAVLDRPPSTLLLPERPVGRTSAYAHSLRTLQPLLQ